MLDDAQVTALLPAATAVAAIRAGCEALRRRELEAPPRTTLDDGAVLVMPAWHRPTGTGVVKTVTVRPDGVRGTVDWLAADGTVLPLASAAAFTGSRTAAVTAVAVDAQADPGARRLVVFGTGRQARAHARAIAAVRPLEEVVLIGRDPARAQACRAELAVDLPAVDVRLSRDLGRELRAADLVCCTTTSATPLFGAGDLGEQVHVSAVGSHREQARELPRALLGSAQEVVVDDVPACLAEAGEVIDAVRSGVVRAPDLVALPERLERPPAAGRTVFKSVGVASYDWALAAALVPHLACAADGPVVARA